MRGVLSNITNSSSKRHEHRHKYNYESEEEEEYHEEEDDVLEPLSKVLHSDDEEEVEEDGSYQEEPSMTLDEAVHQQENERQLQEQQTYKENLPVSTSTNNRQRQSMKATKRRRRRSSARFLRRQSQGNYNNNDNELTFDDDATNGIPSSKLTSEQLRDIYQTTIRLNAENRINGQNTWSLNLIDTMDQMLLQNDGSSSGDGGRDDAAVVDARSGKEGGDNNNFTKASCTLDASVKIYSYRVDDVHLSSYKVLANMNRTQTTAVNDGHDDDDDDDHDDDHTRKQRKQRNSKHSKLQHGENTLCMHPTTASSINLRTALEDRRYDAVDPLFHKMSRAFDEGGARGLLLNNLCVDKGVIQFFDDGDGDRKFSKSDGGNDQDEDCDNVVVDGMNNLTVEVENVDITSLVDKLDSMLNMHNSNINHSNSSQGSSFSQQNQRSLSSLLPFLPQLSDLRCNLADLEEEGYTNDMLPKTPKVSVLYATYRISQIDSLIVCQIYLIFYILVYSLLITIVLYSLSIMLILNLQRKRQKSRFIKTPWNVVAFL